MVRTTRPPRTPARRAFTLVELLVVIGIILLLVSLSVVAIMKAFGYQQRRNTETMIAKVNQAFQKQWIRVVDMAKNEKPSPQAQALSGGDSRRAQVIHVKLRLAQMFPTSFWEAKNAVLGANPAYTRALANASTTGRTWQDESSACLYMALKQSIRGGDFDPDTALSSQEVRDPLGDGIKEIYDGWGNPIVFSRMPGVSWYNGTIGADSAFLLVQDLNTKAYLLNPGQTVSGSTVTPTTTGNDPVDPENLLADSAWVTANSTTYVGATGLHLHPVFPGANYNLKPMIVSLGPDNTINAFTGDDVYSFQVTP
jgi:type II secretory pathway pseudopilin PulG